MFDIKSCENRSRTWNFRRIWIFQFFFIVTSNFKHSIFPRSFLCEEPKIKEHTSLKKKLCEIGEETIWESRFTCFFSSIMLNSFVLYSEFSLNYFAFSQMRSESGQIDIKFKTFFRQGKFQKYLRLFHWCQRRNILLT